MGGEKGVGLPSVLSFPFPSLPARFLFSLFPAFLRHKEKRALRSQSLTWVSDDVWRERFVVRAIRQYQGPTTTKPLCFFLLLLLFSFTVVVVVVVVYCDSIYHQVENVEGCIKKQGNVTIFFQPLSKTVS